MADNLSSPTDELLLARFLKGDRAALGALATRYEPLLLGLAAGILRGRTDLARDAVQDAWIKVIRHGRSFAGNSSFKTWVYRIVINRCRDLLEREQRASKYADPGLRPSDSSVEPPPILASQHTELNGTLRSAVDRLAESHRLIILLCYHRGLTHTEAAEVLAIPVGTLKSRLNAALTELRNSLGLEVIP